jgi:two-component system, LuxR family, secretion system response regulator SsrB
MTGHRLLIVEDHKMFGEALQSILSRLPEIMETRLVSSFAQILAHASSFQPSVVALDISVNQHSTIPLIPQLRELNSSPKILVVTMHSDPVIAQAALRAGATGYLLKDSGSSVLIDGVRAVLDGHRFLEPTACGHEEEASLLFEKYDVLTPREQEVHRLLGEGNKTGTVAKVLGISRKTADVHRYNVMRKLDAETTADLIRIALRLGIVSPRE